VAVSEMKTPN